MQLQFLSWGRLEWQAGEFEYDWLIRYLEVYVLFYGRCSSWWQGTQNCHNKIALSSKILLYTFFLGGACVNIFAYVYGCQESRSALYHCTSLIREIINWEELAAQQVPEILCLTPSSRVTGMHHHAFAFWCNSWGIHTWFFTIVMQAHFQLSHVPSLYIDFAMYLQNWVITSLPITYWGCLSTQWRHLF